MSLRVEDVYLSEENVNGDIFEDFKNSSPYFDAFQWNSYSVVIMDNCSIHHLQRVQEMITSVEHLLGSFHPTAQT